MLSLVWNRMWPCTDAFEVILLYKFTENRLGSSGLQRAHKPQLWLIMKLNCLKGNFSLQTHPRVPLTPYSSALVWMSSIFGFSCMDVKWDWWNWVCTCLSNKLNRGSREPGKPCYISIIWVYCAVFRASVTSKTQTSHSERLSNHVTLTVHTQLNKPRKCLE